MLFSAHLRLPPQRTREEKEGVVAAILADLGMEDCAGVKVQAISGGQRRRVSVGLELIVNPSVLILDVRTCVLLFVVVPLLIKRGRRRPYATYNTNHITQEPTSGLDSKTAEDICLLLKALARPGRLVICSIHQPAFKIFSVRPTGRLTCCLCRFIHPTILPPSKPHPPTQQSFSRLCFLVKGRLAYAGAFSHVMPYFEKLGFSVPIYENPSDYYMRIMQTEGPALTDAWATAAPPIAYPSPSANSLATTGKAASPLGRFSATLWKTAASVGEEGLAAGAPWDPQGKWLLVPEAKSRVQATASGWQQYRVLLHRFLADSYKDRGKMLSGVVMEGAIGLLVGLVWYQQDVRDSGSAFAIAGVFIMLTTIAIFDNVVSVGLKFPVLRALHLKEFRCEVFCFVGRWAGRKRTNDANFFIHVTLTAHLTPHHHQTNPHSNGYYRLLPYYLASVTSSLLLSATYQLVQALLVFFLVGLDFTWLKFGGYLLVLSLAAGMGAFLGFIVGTHTSDLKRTQELLTPILMPMILFSGYMYVGGVHVLWTAPRRSLNFLCDSTQTHTPLHPPNPHQQAAPPAAAPVPARLLLRELLPVRLLLAHAPPLLGAGVRRLQLPQPLLRAARGRLPKHLGSRP